MRKNPKMHSNSCTSNDPTRKFYSPKEIRAKTIKKKFTSHKINLCKLKFDGRSNLHDNCGSLWTRQKKLF